MKSLFRLIPVVVMAFSMPLWIYAQPVKIFVASDLHYFDPDLIINDGQALNNYLTMDRKMIRESAAILEALIEKILDEQPDFVLIPGDLTKDGELTSHQKLAGYFQLLENAGIEVFVVPGNHDINNPHAFAFDGPNVIPVPTVSPAQFKTIYANFGFNQAIATDPHSLTYIVEPVPGLWIFCMDVCKYDNNFSLNKPETGGRFKPETYNWIVQKLQQAAYLNKRVLGMMHHGMYEHYQGQATLFSEYVIENWQSVSGSFADLGMEAVFTGHYHAQDIVRVTTPNGNTMYDIETGSMVTYPCPYRIVTIENNLNVTITGGVIEEINYDLGGMDFQTYALNYITTGLPVLVSYILGNPPYNLPQPLVQMMTPAITEAFIAHYAGNEGDPSPQSQGVINYLLSIPQLQMFGYAIMALWNDPEPDDWNYSFTFDFLNIPTGNLRLTILHNSDGESELIHSNYGPQYGGVAKFKTVVDSLRALASKNNGLSIMISSGDNFLAGPQFSASLNLPSNQPYYDAVAMDHIGYDAICLGNHDFDFGPDVLEKFISDFTITQPPFLGANLDFSGEPGLQTLVNANRIKKSTILNINGHLVGIVGLITPMLPYISSPRNVTVDPNLVQVAQAEIDALLSQNVKKIILISHLQTIAEDAALISQLRNVDIAIAGGSDVLLTNDPSLALPGMSIYGSYPLYYQDADGKTIPVVSVPGGYAYVGRLVVEFNENGEIIEIGPESNPVLVKNATPNPTLVQLVQNPVNSYVQNLANNVITITQVTLDGLRPNIRSIETNLGDLCADALLWQARLLAPSYGAQIPQVAIQNGGGIRNNSLIHASSPVTELNTFSILPFANFVCVVEDISPLKFKQILENAVSRVEFGDGRFAQVAGFRFTWDPTGIRQIINAQGQITQQGTRVREAVLDDGTVIIQNGAIVPGAPNIAMATIDFLARGGDQYPFGNLPFKTLGVTYQQALYNYLQYLNQSRSGGITSAKYPEGGNARVLNNKQQNLHLAKGWSLISGYIDPTNDAMNQIFKKVVDNNNFIIALGFNGIYWPAQNINTFTGGWDELQGYKVKMNKADYILLRGLPVNTMQIPLKKGSNYMPVPVPYSVNAGSVFSQVQNNLLYAFDIQNGKVYWPLGGIFTLNKLVPGIGYLVVMSENATVDFSGLKGELPDLQIDTPIAIQSPWLSELTGNYHLVALSAESLEKLEEGDIIAVFGKDNRFAGQVQVVKNGENLLLVVFGDDHTSHQSEGMLNGERMILKLYRPLTGEIFDLEPTYSDLLPERDFFKPSGASMITNLKIEVGNVPSTNLRSVLEFYPNPANDFLHIKYTGQKPANIQIYNLVGQIMTDIPLGGDSGINTISIALDSYPSGMFMVKISTEDETETMKLIKH